MIWSNYYMPAHFFLITWLCVQIMLCWHQCDFLILQFEYCFLSCTHWSFFKLHLLYLTDLAKWFGQRCVRDFRSLLSELITPEAAVKHNEEGKNALNSFHEAKKVLKDDPRYSKMPRRERESLWRKHADDVQRRMKATNSTSREDNHLSASGRASTPPRVSSDHRSRSPGRRSPGRRSPGRRSPGRRIRR